MAEKYYDITVTKTLEVSVRVLAEDEADAKDKVDSLDGCYESCDVDVVIYECSEQNSDIESTTCVNEDKWDAMGAAEKISFLTEHGVEDADALHWVSDEDNHYNDIEEYLEHIEVD